MLRIKEYKRVALLINEAYKSSVLILYYRIRNLIIKMWTYVQFVPEIVYSLWTLY